MVRERKWGEKYQRVASIVETEILSTYCNRFYANKPELASRRIEAIGYQVDHQLFERYDIDMFLTHRFLTFGEAEVRVRYVGFGSEEDEWVNVKKQVRVRSIPLEHSECHKVKVGDLVLCFRERSDQARYYDACIVDIQRKLHDFRGCKCLFLI